MDLSSITNVEPEDFLQEAKARYHVRILDLKDDLETAEDNGIIACRLSSPNSSR